MTQVCPACKASSPITARFCVSCHYAFDYSPLTQPTAPQAPQSAKKLCIGCRTINQVEAAYCYRCGLKLPEVLYPQASMTGNPAGFWIRMAAYLIDQILLSIAAILLAVLFAGMDVNEAINQSVGVATGWATSLIATGLGVIYYTLAIGQWGQTVGKAILGLKVTRGDGSRLSFQRSFARCWAYLVSTIPLGLGFISIALSSQKRSWHDFICDTRVVNLRG
ncbi:MAG: RDD family protein [Chloroflexi bacterium]|nr:RDD family protein [Chloroflexota bacterium]